MHDKPGRIMTHNEKLKACLDHTLGTDIPSEIRKTASQMLEQHLKHRQCTRPCLPVVNAMVRHYDTLK